MDNNNTLLIRWDSAPHHRELKTFPYHVHIGSEENVEESIEMTLYDVLSYIRSIVIPLS